MSDLKDIQKCLEHSTAIEVLKAGVAANADSAKEIKKDIKAMREFVFSSVVPKWIQVASYTFLAGAVMALSAWVLKINIAQTEVHTHVLDRLEHIDETLTNATITKE